MVDNSTSTHPEFLPIDRWCALSGMSRSGVYSALNDHNLKAIKLGKRVMIDVPAGLAWLRSLPQPKIRLSGSTAWNNSVRSRSYLTRPKPDSEDQDTDHDVRFLKTMKNNSGPYGGKIKIRWVNGVFVPDNQSNTTPSNIVDRIELDQKILGAVQYLVENGARIAADPNARNNLANQVRTVDGCRNISSNVLRAAQDRLVSNGRLTRIELGPPSKRYVFLRPLDVRYPGEAEL